MSRDKERTIAYRLGLPYVSKLEEQASEQGMSACQYARLVLVMHFEETAAHRVADEIAKLRGEVSDLRVEHAIGRQGARSPH